MCCLQLSDSNAPCAGGRRTFSHASSLILYDFWYDLMFQLLFHLLLCLPFFVVCYEVIGLLAKESHQNNTYLLCWLVMSLNTVCMSFNQRYYLHKVTFIFYICTFCSSVWVYFVVQKRKVTVVNYVTTLWITLPIHLAVQWIQAQLHRI